MAEILGAARVRLGLTAGLFLLLLIGLGLKGSTAAEKPRGGNRPKNRPGNRPKNRPGNRPVDRPESPRGSRPVDRRRNRRETVLDRVLKAARLRRSDLFIKRNIAPPDFFRLEAVNTLLEQPLRAPAYCRDLSRNLLRFGAPAEILTFMAERERFGGAAVAVDKKKEPGGTGSSGTTAKPPAPGRVSPEASSRMEVVEKAIRTVLHGVESARRKGSFGAGLSANERKLLKRRTVGLLTRGEDGMGEEETEHYLALAGRFDKRRTVAAARAVLSALEDAVGILQGLRKDAGRPKEEKGSERSPRKSSRKDSRKGSRKGPGKGSGEGPKEGSGPPEVLLRRETPYGPVIVTGPGSDIHRAEAFLIIDLGGNDCYLGRHAGGDHATSIVIDLAGDDLYLADAPLAQGAGLFGIGVLLDLAGDDTYRARALSQGCGVFGVGVLDDRGGEDVYVGGESCQGASAFGYSILADRGGNDQYTAALYSQAFAFVGGCSALVEARGNDSYLTGRTYEDYREKETYQCLSQGFAYGLRPLASGGIAVLADGGGNDTYTGDYFAQGSSYWLGLGVLYDGGGKDKYVARRYSQGAGIHLSVGVLIDEAGDDDYVSWGVSQGCGHDYAVGYLADLGGNDSYSADWLSQGAGNANGIGILWDAGGKDGYLLKGTKGLGYGTFSAKREAGSIGILIDTGGADSYNVLGGNGKIWTQAKWGAAIDREGGIGPLEVATAQGDQAEFPGLRAAPEAKAGTSGAKAGAAGAKAGTAGAKGRSPGVERDRSGRMLRDGKDRLSPEEEKKAKDREQEKRPHPEKSPLEKRMEKLLEAVAGVRSGRKEKEDAKRAILDLGEEAYPFLVEKTDSADIMVLITAMDLLKEIGAPAVPYFIRYYGKVGRRGRSVILHLIGEIGDARGLGLCLRGVEDKAWQVRRSAARALGKLGMEEGAEPLHALLGDGDKEVRGEAALALGRLGSAEALPILTPLLEDPYYNVRNQAARAMVLLGRRAEPHAVSALGSRDPLARVLAVDVLARLGGDLAKRRILSELNDGDWFVRAEAARALKDFPGTESRRALRRLLAGEKDDFVRDMARSVLDALRRKAKEIFY
jgi:hypothetical protein